MAGWFSTGTNSWITRNDYKNKEKFWQKNPRDDVAYISDLLMLEYFFLQLGSRVLQALSGYIVRIFADGLNKRSKWLIEIASLPHCTGDE